MVGFVSYEIENDKAYKANIDKAIEQVGNLRFAMGEISRDFYKDTKKNFILKGNGGYKELNGAYKLYKDKVKPNTPILVFSGSLRDSVTKPSDSNAIRKIGNKSLVQGTDVSYAKYVQEGTRHEPTGGQVAGKVKMPARKFLFIDDAQSERITRILGDYVESKLEVLGDVK